MAFLSQTNNEPITAAESTRHSWELEQNREARAHDLVVRKQELEVLKRQTSWSALMQVPLAILKLPLYILLGFAYIVCCFTKVTPPDEFWKLLS